MKKKEANWSTKKMKAWCEHHLLPPAIVEAKHSRDKDYISFSEFRMSQRNWGMVAIGNKGKMFKLSDISPEYKPGDYFLIGLQDYWVAIKYPTCFVVIDIEKFLDEEKRSERKSLTEDRAVKIAQHIVWQK